MSPLSALVALRARAIAGALLLALVIVACGSPAEASALRGHAHGAVLARAGDRRSGTTASAGGILGESLAAATAGLAPAGSSGAFGWGANEFGELGIGTTTPEESLVPVQACAAGPQAACPSGPFLSEVATVSAGASFSVALLSNATVMAWGENSSDQLGNGTTEAKSNVPVAVPGLSEVTAIAAGHNHTLALLRNGTVVAWGENSSGQLGNGTTTNSRTPVAVNGLSGVTAIAAGGFFSLALLSDGTVMAWGGNFSGELGIGTTTKSAVPVKVCAAGPQAACPTGPFLSEVTAIAAAEGVGMALLKNGTVKDWGGNPEGGLGNGTTTASDVPVAVSGLSGVVGLPNSGAHMALLSNGTVMDWGSNGRGELGDGTTTGPEHCGTGEACSTVPVMVTGLSGVTAIAAGGEFRLAVSNGAGEAWGSNTGGQLGNGTTTQSDVPVAVSGLSGITAVAAGGGFSLAAAASLAPLPTVTQVEPNHGSPGGGTAVTITGTNFTGATAVKFGSTNAASFTVNSATSITAVSPAGTGLVNVTVTTAAGTSPTGPNFNYRPFVSQVLPRDGANAGGTSVEIIGTNFNEVEAVKFGSTNVSFTRNSETSITAVSPPFPGGSARVLVTVTTKGGVNPERGSTILGEEYFGYAPTVTHVSPTSGPAAGGTSVAIEGTAFESIRKADEFPPFVASVKFGSINATSFTVNSEGRITAVAPAGTGTVDVTVETYAGTSLTSSADRYTFIPSAPTVGTCVVPEPTQTTATLCATVNPNGGEVSECEFEWGPTSAYGLSVPCTPPPGSGTSPVTVTATITGLTPNTIYHFRVVATNAGGVSHGQDQSLKTLPNPPTAVTGTASSITSSSATLNATVNPNGGEVSGCKFEYGTTTAYGSSAACVPSPGSVESPVAVSASVSGLSPNTTYHFRIAATNRGGTSSGSDQTFVTLLLSGPTFVTSFTPEESVGSFQEPDAVALDPSGNIWVADSGHDRVLEFNKERKFIRQFGVEGTGAGQYEGIAVSGIAGIATNSSGDVYVTGSDRVQEFSPTGAFLRQWGSPGSGNGQFLFPYGIAVDSSGNVWVLDTFNYRVQEFSESGGYLGQFGSEGSGNGQLGWASDLAFSGGNLYVADGARVQEFSTAGTYLAQFGSSGTGNGQFHGLGGIASDPTTGNLYVADTYNNRVQEFNAAGAFIAAFGSGGSGAGQFSGPRGMAVNTSGTLYVADGGNNRMEEWVGR